MNQTSNQQTNRPTTNRRRQEAKPLKATMRELLLAKFYAPDQRLLVRVIDGQKHARALGQKFFKKEEV